MRTLTDKDFIDFGVHKGKRLENVPASWLIWAWNTFLKEEVEADTERGALARYVQECRSALEKDCPDSIMD